VRQYPPAGYEPPLRVEVPLDPVEVRRHLRLEADQLMTIFSLLCRSSRPVIVLAGVLILPAQELTAQSADPIAPPKNLWAAQNSPTSIILVWSSSPGAAGYRVSVGGKIERTGASTLRWVVPISGGMFGKPFQASIQAVDASGLVSETAEFPRVTPVRATQETVPPPTSVTALQTGPGRISVAWSTVQGATAYDIGRSVAPEGFRSLCPICPTSTQYVDSTVTAGAKHIYAVAAVTPQGVSRRAMSAAVIPTGGEAVDTTALPPKGVTDPKAAVVSATSVKLTWKSDVGATQYRLLRSLAGGTFTNIATLPGTAISFVDVLPVGGMLGGVRYQMLSLNAKGSSAPVLFNEIPPDKGAVDTTTLPPKGVTDPKAAVVSATSVKLTWKSDVGATQYRLLRSLAGGTFTNIATLPGTAISFVDVLPVGGMLGGVRYQMLSLNAKGSSAPVLFNEIPPAKSATDTTTNVPDPEPELDPDLGPVIKP
jgi:hypothetical protein